MLFSQSEYVKASDLLEAFVKVAATTVGAVVAFAFYMLVLVALHVTKVVSHLMLFVGDFLDLLADELIVCIYKRADTIAAPSHSVRVFTRSHLQNITAEEEDASIAPLPEHVLLFHLIFRIHILRNRWTPPLLPNPYNCWLILTLRRIKLENP